MPMYFPTPSGTYTSPDGSEWKLEIDDDGVIHSVKTSDSNLVNATGTFNVGAFGDGFGRNGTVTTVVGNNDISIGDDFDPPVSVATTLSGNPPFSSDVQLSQSDSGQWSVHLVGM